MAISKRWLRKYITKPFRLIVTDPYTEESVKIAARVAPAIDTGILATNFGTFCYGIDKSKYVSFAAWISAAFDLYIKNKYNIQRLDADSISDWDRAICLIIE